MWKRVFLAQIALLLWATWSLATPLQPVELEPIEHFEAQLVIERPDGTEVSYSPAELETFATYRMRTTTPWREVPADFEGIRLADLLELNGLGAVDAIRVIAENDYAVTIEREVWEETPILVATRVDGKAHTRRERGPIQFVVDMAGLESSDVVGENHLVWMAARIEAD